jgi:hypothetical protein
MTLPTMVQIKNWFWHSETMFFSALNLLFGIVWGALSVADLSPLLSPKWLAIWGIVNGIVTGLLRLRGTETVTVMTRPDPAEPQLVVPVTMLSSAPPPGA